MAQTINMLPARVAIGRTDDTGAVYMTPEFSRVLTDLLARVGGPAGASSDDLAADLALVSAQGMALLVVDLQMQVAALSAQIGALLAAQAPEPDTAAAGLAAQVQALASGVANMELDAARTTPPTDWDHPGAIGRTLPNAGRFTDLTATGKFGCNGKQAQPAVASGGTLAGTIAALVSCGILAS